MTTTSETPDTTEEGDKGKGNSEAARHRVRAREAEAERDALAARVARLQTSEVHRLASARMADASDLEVYGVAVADLLDEDGEVDEAKVEAAVDDLLERKPRLGLEYEPEHADGHDGGARTSVRVSGATWGSLLNGAQP